MRCKGRAQIPFLIYWAQQGSALEARGRRFSDWRDDDTLVIRASMWTLGQVVNGHYRVMEEAARGEAGVVCRALDERSGKICEIEFIAFDSGTERNWREPLDLDFEKLRALENPLIVTPDAIEETQNGLLAVREALEGSTLEEEIRTQAPLSLPRACFIARCVAMALEAAHHAGIVHGDLKPSNILLVRQNNKEQVKVLDFGTFGLKKNSFINMARLTLSGGRPVSGAAGYVSPEQALGTVTEALDGRSDVYSLGVILYQALSGRMPFKGQSTMEVLLAHVFSVPLSLAQFPELAIPEVVDSLVLRCLAKRREDRPPSATALVDQLGPWAERDLIIEPAEAEPALPARDEPLVVSPREPVLGPPALEKPVLPQKTQEPKDTPEFVADLHVPRQTETAVHSSPIAVALDFASPPTSPASIDIMLNPVPKAAAAVFKKASTSQHAIDPGAEIFKNYMPRQKAKPSSKGGTKWVWAAAILLLLIGGGCGWLFYTGRTYWFRPEFLQRRISLMLTNFSAGAASNDSPRVNQIPDGGSATAPLSSAPPGQSPAPPAAAASSLATSAPVTPPPAKSSPSPSAPATPRRAKSSLLSVPTVAHQRSNAGTPIRSARFSSIQEAMERGESYFERGQYDDAIRAYQSGLAQDPSNIRLRADIVRARKAKAAEAKFLSQ